MRALPAVCAVLVSVLIATVAVATEYHTVGPQGHIHLFVPVWNPWFVHAGTYQVHRIDWRIENHGPETYHDVKLVLPFAWVTIDDHLQAYDYVDASGDWHWSDADDDFYLAADTSVSAPASAPLSYMLMGDTDVPRALIIGTKTTTVLPTDSVPAWDVTPSLGPHETVVITTYLRQEVDPRVGELRHPLPFVVAAIPEPATIGLIGAGLAALLLRRRKR